MWGMAQYVDEWRPVMAMLLFNLISAVMTALVKEALQQGLNSLVLITLRQLVATVFLAPIAYFKERNIRPKFTLGIFVYHFFSAALGASLSQYTFFYGLKLTTATFAITFANMAPVLTFLIAIALRVESLNMKSKAGSAKIVGTLMSFGGALLVSLYKGVAVTHQNPVVAAHHAAGPASSSSQVVTVLGNCLFFSLWLLLQSRLTKKYPALYSSTSIMFFISTLQAGALTVTIERHSSVWIVTRRLEILTILYSGIFASAVGFVIMTWCVHERGPVFTAAFIPVVQIMVAIIDFFFLHEQIYLGSILGSTLMIFGLYLLLWGKKKDASARCTDNKQVDEEADNEEQQAVK
ncbi:hypothetical protein HU200_046830 [Digitaria exilis]|uniref:WAT1-related protein n=1 Tax=Digitaria exilis TaxID=1010633 RepID=A0A835AYS4_9POAL|nr:hypothetical protein HU200_046830 [Digitaria exilis]